MRTSIHLSALPNLQVWLWLALVFTSCEDSFMKQATANKMGAVANLQTTIDDAGNFVAQIDPSKAETQLMRITEGAIAGAAVAIPPSALSIPVSIMVGEGVALTTNSFSKDLGLTGNAITAGGPSVSFTASQDVVASNPLTLSIPFGALAFALAEVDTDNLVVMYRWLTLKDGEPSYEVGVIPGDKVTRGQNKVSFQTTKFGTFQVGISETKITKPLLAATEEPPALKSCERYAAAAFPTCTQDGQVGCVTTESFKAADLSLAKSEFILAGKTMAGVSGAAPARPATCSSDGEMGCVVVGPNHRAALITGADAKIISGASVAGINGTAPSRPSDCDADAASNCVVDGPDFAAAKISGAAQKILKGYSVAGIEGAATLPPVGSVLAATRYGNPDAQSIGLLTLPYPDKVLAGSGFYGDPAAQVQPTLPSRGTLNLTDAFPGAGYYTDANNPPDASKIASGTRILGIDGSLIGGAVSVQPWNLRAGVTVGEVTGNLRTNCRNTGNPLVYTTQTPQTATITGTFPLQIKFNSQAIANTYNVGEQLLIKVVSGSALLTNNFKIDAITADTAVMSASNGSTYGSPLLNSTLDIYRFLSDPWETVDDSLFSNIYQSILPRSWDFWNQCGGIRNATNLDGQWIDMTFASSSFTACTSASCALLDTTSKLIWSRKSNTTTTTDTWDAAKHFCLNDPVLNTYPDSNIFKWRLPTQKELMAAYVNGLSSVLNQAQLMDRAKTVWSSTNFLSATGTSATQAWTMYLATGQINASLKTLANNTLCVRDIGTTVIPGTAPAVP